MNSIIKYKILITLLFNLILINELNCIENTTMVINSRNSIIEARSPTSFDYTINLLANLNTRFVFPTQTQTNLRVTLWLLYRHTIKTFTFLFFSFINKLKDFLIYCAIFCPRQ